jgi:hypothetical protein
MAAGLAVALAAGGFGLNALRDSDKADANDGAIEWIDVAGNDNPNCLELADASGTAETYKMTIGDKEVTLVHSDNGFDQEGKLFNNSMRAPFETGPDVEKVEAELKTGFCEDAPFAVGTASTLGNVVYQGKRLADTEEGAWLAPYADLTAEELDEKAEYLIGFDLKADDVDEHYARYQEHQELAENLAATLTNLNNNGLRVGATDVDVSYVDQSFVSVEGIPEMVISKNQFTNAEAIEFTANLKGEVCEDSIIAFNTGDQRPETFVPEVCEEVPPTEAVTPTTPGEGRVTTTTRRGATTTTTGGSTTTIPGSTTTSWRTSDTVTGNTTIENPGAGGTPDNDNDPNNNTTTSTTSTTQGPGPTTTTTQAGSVTSTTLGNCGEACA